MGCCVINYTKPIMIVGGSGSLGNQLVYQLIENKGAKNIIVYSRNEFLQIQTQRKFNSKYLKCVPGDVRDKNTLDRICKLFGVEYIFHLAAFKHVPVCEEFPWECIQTNVIGSQNIIEVSIANKIKKVIFMSTDKAVTSNNVYGLSKSLAEKLFIQANQLNGTRFLCIRGGNVLGSNGSVIPFFIDQIKTQNKVTLTHEFMTRFFLGMPDAISLLLVAAERGVGGETFILKMPACRMVDLIESLKQHYGNKNTSIEIIGLRPGEKIREQLVSEYETPNTYEYDDNHYVILPGINIEGLREYYNGLNLKKLNIKTYSSNYKLMSVDEITLMLKKNNLLV